MLGVDTEKLWFKEGGGDLAAIAFACHAGVLQSIHHGCKHTPPPPWDRENEYKNGLRFFVTSKND